MARHHENPQGWGGLADRRKLKGRLVNLRAQLRFSLLIGSVSFVVLAVFMAVTSLALDRAVGYLELTHGLQPGLAAVLRRSFTDALMIAMVLAILLVGIAMLFGLLWSHRVYGPLIPLTRHIQELKSGNFASRVNLRRSDELCELQSALNDLAESLEARYGSSGAGAGGTSTSNS